MADRATKPEARSAAVQNANNRDSADPDTYAEAKIPRTERGRRTLRRLLDASAIEFGEKGFHEASVSSITRRAGMALGSFYTYFDSKDALFRALVRDMSENVRNSARAAITEDMNALDTERAALTAFLDFTSEHKEVYRIIDEAEFVDPASYREHYETIAARIGERLRNGAQAGEMRADLSEVEAWAIMGMNVFIGLRFAIWANADDTLSHEEIASQVNRLLASGIAEKD